MDLLQTLQATRMLNRADEAGFFAEQRRFMQVVCGASRETERAAAEEASLLRVAARAEELLRPIYPEIRVEVKQAVRGWGHGSQVKFHWILR